MKKITTLIFVFLLIVPASGAKFRDIDSTGFENEIPVVDTSSYNYPKGTLETINVVKDNNEKLYGVVGKSQVLNFNADIERVSITDNKLAEIVVLSPNQLLINGKAAGNTSIIFWSAGNPSPVFYNLVIQPNVDPFIQAIEHVAPNENISLMFNDTGVVLTGHISSTSVKEKITNLAKAYDIHLTDMTESPAKQVLLEVKITEASKTFARSLGLNLITGRNLSSNTADWAQSGSRAAIAQSNSGALQLGYILPGKHGLGIDFEASEAKGDLRVLAEPKLLSVNGEQGSFSVGSQVPVPSEMGNYGNISYDYKDTGVLLKFTPTIMEESGRIRLELQPEVSEVDNSVTVASTTGATVYGFKTRKVQTTVELMDGETLVIAGLLQNSSSKSRTQVPILGNIPVLGALFSTTDEDRDDEELVIFITPRIVDNYVKLDSL
ncbi:MAG: pilus assembly protein N-terminal domain-containing protein [Candidatus Gastranaerophilales bacterium]|nr:pilus assembly protein N-terminal domain-containing protein [Candidatus Gastranaerophilales bacterium]